MVVRFNLEFLLVLAALVLAAIEEFRAGGHSLLAWAVILLAVALLITGV